MKKFTLNNGTNIDAIGLGTYKLTDALTEGMTKQIILDGLAVGYRYIDTAAFYGNEREIGQAIAESGLPREEIFLATKVWKTELGYEKTKKAISDSLKRLNTSYLDLYLIHWPKETPGDLHWKEKIQGSWKAMEEAYEAGILKNLGLSNFLPHHIMALMETAKVKPVLDQLELHAGHMQYAAVVYCMKHQIQVQAWSPLGRKRLFQLPELQEMAESYGVGITDLLLRFLLQQGIAVIPKAAGIDHLKANLNPAQFTISQADMQFLLCLPSIGWAGEHPDFERAAVDNRFLPSEKNGNKLLKDKIGQLESHGEEAGSGFRHFCEKEWTFTWQGSATWDVKYACVDINGTGFVTWQVSDTEKLKKYLSPVLNRNPYTSEDKILQIITDELTELLDNEYQLYADEDDYYPPVGEDFEFAYIVREFCEKHGLGLISCDYDGYTDD